MSTYNELHDAVHNRLNIRDAQKSIGLIGRKRDIDALDLEGMDPGALPDFKELGFDPLGIVTTDGWNFGREESNKEATGHGFADVLRIDVESVNRTVSVTVKETWLRTVRELVKGADYSNISFSSGGFLVLDEAEMPDHDEWSLVVLFRDGSGEDEIIFGRYFGTVKLESSGDESHGGDGYLEQELTLRVFRDEETGTPVREFYGGPGFEKLSEGLGYGVATPAG